MIHVYQAGLVIEDMAYQCDTGQLVCSPQSYCIVKKTLAVKISGE